MTSFFYLLRTNVEQVDEKDISHENKALSLKKYYIFNEEEGH